MHIQPPAIPASPDRRRSAFTLVEILMVIVILGIASAMVIPQLAAGGDLRAAAGARVLMADLMYAQNRAITMQRTHYVRFDLVQQQYAVYDDIAMTTPLIHPVQRAPYIQSFGGAGPMAIPDATLVTATLPTDQTIGFDSLGQPLAVSSIGEVTSMNADGKIVVASGDHQMQLTIKPFTGEINVTAVQ